MHKLRYYWSAQHYRISFIYFGLSFLWILLSDKVLLLFSSDPNWLSDIQTYKGWFFVFISSMLIYFLIRSAIRNKNELIDKLNNSEQRFKLLSDLSLNGLVFYKGETIVDINQALCTI